MIITNITNCEKRHYIVPNLYYDKFIKRLVIPTTNPTRDIKNPSSKIGFDVIVVTKVAKLVVTHVNKAVACSNNVDNAFVTSSVACSPIKNLLFIYFSTEL